MPAKDKLLDFNEYGGMVSSRKKPSPRCGVQNVGYMRKKRKEVGPWMQEESEVRFKAKESKERDFNKKEENAGCTFSLSLDLICGRGGSS